jgi:HNH endonuclease/NUMOD4 motif
MWKDIPGWEGFYQASTGGVVRSVDRKAAGRHGLTRYRGRELIPGRGKYPLVKLTKSGRKMHEYVHRLVARTFLGVCPAGLEVRHLNGDGKDSRLANLQYSTRQENMNDRIVHGTSKHRTKVRSLYVVMIPWCTKCNSKVTIDHEC